MPLCKFKISHVFYGEYSFANYPDQIEYLTEWHEFPILRNMTTFEQTLPISLNISKFDTSLLTALKTLKDFIYQYESKKEIFDLKERNDNMDKNLPNKNFFSDNFIIDVFCLLLQQFHYWSQLWQYIYCANMRNSEC